MWRGGRKERCYGIPLPTINYANRLSPARLPPRKKSLARGGSRRRIGPSPFLIIHKNSRSGRAGALPDPFCQLPHKADCCTTNTYSATVSLMGTIWHVKVPRFIEVFMSLDQRYDFIIHHILIFVNYFYTNYVFSLCFTAVPRTKIHCNQ